MRMIQTAAQVTSVQVCTTNVIRNLSHNNDNLFDSTWHILTVVRTGARQWTYLDNDKYVTTSGNYYVRYSAAPQFNIKLFSLNRTFTSNSASISIAGLYVNNKPITNERKSTFHGMLMANEIMFDFTALDTNVIIKIDSIGFSDAGLTFKGQNFTYADSVYFAGTKISTFTTTDTTLAFAQTSPLLWGKTVLSIYYGSTAYSFNIKLTKSGAVITRQSDISLSNGL